MTVRKNNSDSPCPENLQAEAENLSVEEIFGHLEHILSKLEDGEVSLEESFAYYEKGMGLVKTCHEKLDKVEKKILVLNGQEMEEP